MLPVATLACASTLIPGGTARAFPETVQYEFQKITPTAGLPQDNYGFDVAMDGEFAVVGAPYDDTLGEDAGTAWILRYDGAQWTEVDQLLSSAGMPGDLFGFSVAIDQDVMVIGTPYSGEFGWLAGLASVYRYDGNSWNFDQFLYPADIETTDFFGGSVAVDGDVIVVGAASDSHSGLADAGSAYVFRDVLGAWVEEQKLTAYDAEGGDTFGDAVAVDGTTIADGAPGDDGMGYTDIGSVYVFDFSGPSWGFTEKAYPPDPIREPGMGLDVALEGDLLVAGAWGDSSIAPLAGSAYVFERNGTFGTGVELAPEQPLALDFYGMGVEVNQGRVLIGAARKDDVGAAFLYEQKTGGGWKILRRFEATDAFSLCYFGISVALDGDRALVGARLMTGPAGATGAAYGFDVPEGGLPVKPCGTNRALIGPDC
jgi:hypothetical protein